MRNIDKKYTSITWKNEKFKSAGDEDKFIIDFFNHKKNGYLLDIACACPVSGSLTYKLLNYYNWNGILVEPSLFHKENIESCYGDVEGVYFYNGAIHQSEKEILLYQPKSPNEVGWASLNQNHVNHMDHISYKVQCLKINDLLSIYNAPKQIDFINLDIEGSESQVLDYLDYEKYDVKLFCIENGGSYETLMIQNGYTVCDTIGYNIVHGNLFFQKNN